MFDPFLLSNPVLETLIFSQNPVLGWKTLLNQALINQITCIHYTPLYLGLTEYLLTVLTTPTYITCFISVWQVFWSTCERRSFDSPTILRSGRAPCGDGCGGACRSKRSPGELTITCFLKRISGLVTNSIIFCWLFTIKDRCKNVRFQQMHNQGLHQ